MRCSFCERIKIENAVASKTYENISPHCEAGHKNIETRAYIYVTTCKAL